MNRIQAILICLLFISTSIFAEEAGNRAYGTQRRKPAVITGVLTGNTDAASRIYFIEANVLVNMKADAYVAVFGVVEEAPTAADSNSKVDTQIAAFTQDLEKLGVKRSDTFVDFITQNKVYDYPVSGGTVIEKLTGFETKKNVAVRYKDRDMLEKIVSAATKASIFDLIEVKYVVTGLNEVHTRLYDEAVKVIKQKESNYARSFGIKLTPTNMANEKYDSFYPSELYANYQAYEAGTTYGDYNNRVVQQRKTKTFYYDPVDDSNFDLVVNQMGIEPMVQFTLYLRMQYDLAAAK